jgi:hypothetical protein
MKGEAVEVAFDDAPESMRVYLISEHGSRELAEKRGVKIFRYLGSRTYSIVMPETPPKDH